jgi:hypothetical protein
MLSGDHPWTELPKDFPVLRKMRATVEVGRKLARISPGDCCRGPKMSEVPGSLRCRIVSVAR